MRPGLVAAVIVLAACGGSDGTPGNGASICTTIACVDQLVATLHDASGGLPAGKQVLTVTANGATLTCSFTLPRPTQTTAITCPKGLQVLVQQSQSCVTSGTGQYQTQTCTPIAGKNDELVTVVGSPTTLQVVQTANGVTYLDETTTPTYTTSRPNGPSCEPVCSQAAMDWVLAAQ